MPVKKQEPQAETHGTVDFKYDSTTFFMEDIGKLRFVGKDGSKWKLEEVWGKRGTYNIRQVSE